MNVHQAIKTRRSVRNYKPDSVPEEKLKKVLEAGRLAPSAHNEQEWKFMVVKNAEKRKKLAKAALNQEFVGEAPVVIAAVALEPEEVMSSGVPNYAVDLAIAIDHMTLAAVEEGLGTCWVGAFSQEEVKKVLGIPERCKVVVLLPLGFPADKPKPKSRKKLEEIICYENYY
jgi:nitroreductase